MDITDFPDQQCNKEGGEGRKGGRREGEGGRSAEGENDDIMVLSTIVVPRSEIHKVLPRHYYFLSTLITHIHISTYM